MKCSGTQCTTPGIKARVSHVQWSKPHSILAPPWIRTQTAGFKVMSGNHYTIHCALNCIFGVNVLSSVYNVWWITGRVWYSCLQNCRAGYVSGRQGGSTSRSGGLRVGSVPKLLPIHIVSRLNILFITFNILILAICFSLHMRITWMKFWISEITWNDSVRLRHDDIVFNSG